MFRKLLARIGSPEATPAWSLLTALLLLVGAFVAIIVGATIGSLLFPDAQFVLLGGWTIAALLAIGITLTNLNKPGQREGLRLTQSGALPSAFFILLIGIGLAITLDVILQTVTRVTLPAPELMDAYFRVQLTQQSIQPLTLILALVFMVLLQPLTDELIFRGALLPVLRSTFGRWPGYIISTLLYAAFHMLLYPPPIPNTVIAAWYGFMAPLIAGLIFGAVRLHTGSTRAAIFTHAAFGLFAVINLLTLASRS